MPSGFAASNLMARTPSLAVGTADRVWLSVLPTEGFTFFLLCDIIYLSATETGGIYGEAA